MKYTIRKIIVKKIHTNFCLSFYYEFVSSYLVLVSEDCHSMS